MNRVLIANRGEIALRIARGCAEAGLEAVAAYTRADAGLAHLSGVAETCCIGETSYLGIADMVMAATTTGCDAVHPGYGFLAENAAFAAAVEGAGLVFVGPRPDTMETMGDKARAREMAARHGLSPVPGSGVIDTADDLAAAVELTGYPLLLKARAGGGGRGIRVVDSAASLHDVFDLARAEANAAFGDGALYAEKYLERSRHIEVQVAGDGEGGAIHLGTRECSIQRRQQKLLEEAPAPGIPESRLADVSERACAFAAAIRYRGVGTLEFLYQDGAFWFIEMNTRLQVEHPVTECVTGIDVVRLQLDIARSGALPIAQSDVVVRGHAIEVRINAEDASGMPGPGVVTGLRWPGGPGVRIDSHLYEGYLVPWFYDSLVGKLICSDSDRASAIARLRRALGETHVGGIPTNIALHQLVLDHPSFVAGTVDTGLFERDIARVPAP